MYNAGRLYAQPNKLLVRIGGKEKSVLELFLLLLDEQSLEISIPLEMDSVVEEDSVVGTLWPLLF
jgi:hypothetical protein